MQIEGRNPVLETLRAKNKIDRLVINSGSINDPKIQEIIKLGKHAQIKIQFKSRKFIDKIADTAVNQGVIAFRGTKSEDFLNFAGLLAQIADRKQTPFLIYIREVLNEYNVGSIMRTAEATGANGIILPPKISLTSQMVRASMGGSEYLPVINFSLFEAIKEAHDNAINVVGIEVTGDKYYYEADLTGPMLLIIGGEDRSLSTPITEKCDAVVKIPLKGKINSLNMSIAASIVMYEKVRQEGV
ncbi:MAG: 23S rRNA (guanosine(2251)-2'-O)-methyltransferase RlmB [bacterium]